MNINMSREWQKQNWLGRFYWPCNQDNLRIAGECRLYALGCICSGQASTYWY